MPTAEVFDSGVHGPVSEASVRRVPWQIWVVVFLLAQEGVANLFAIPSQPIALWWLSAKILFIVGLIKGWTWMFAVFIIVAALHVVSFLETMPIASVLNFLMIVLVYSARQHFFREKHLRNSVL